MLSRSTEAEIRVQMSRNGCDQEEFAAVIHFYRERDGNAREEVLLPCVADGHLQVVGWDCDEGPIYRMPETVGGLSPDLPSKICEHMQRLACEEEEIRLVLAYYCIRDGDPREEVLLHAIDVGFLLIVGWGGPDEGPLYWLPDPDDGPYLASGPLVSVHPSPGLLRQKIW